MVSLGTAKRLTTVPSVDEEFNRIYTNTYEVFTTHTDGGYTVLTTNGLPLWGSSYQWGNDFDFWAFAREFSAEPKERVKYSHTTGDVDALRWRITVKFSTKSSKRNDSGSPRQNPVNDAPILSGSFLSSMRDVFRDKDDNALVNTAVEPIDPPFQLEKGVDTLNMELNTPNINLGTRAGFIGAVNSTEMWGLAVRQVKMVRWDWTVEYSAGGFAFIKNRFEFHISTEEHPDDIKAPGTTLTGWYNHAPNMSYRYLDGSGNKVLVTDEQDNAQMRPVYLDINGAVINDNTTTTYRTFPLEKEKDFLSIAGMPNPLPGPFVTS